MLEVILAVFVAIPSLVIIIVFSVKDLIVDDYNPYDKLKDIDCFESLRSNNGRGIKKFLAAIKYEQLKKGLLLIVDGRNIIYAFGLYFTWILTILLTTGLSELSIITVLSAVLPNIVAAILIIVSLKIKCLKKRIGD